MNISYVNNFKKWIKYLQQREEIVCLLSPHIKDDD